MFGASQERYSSSHLYNMMEALLWFRAAFQPVVLGQGSQNWWNYKHIWFHHEIPSLWHADRWCERMLKIHWDGGTWFALVTTKGSSKRRKTQYHLESVWYTKASVFQHGMLKAYLEKKSTQYSHELASSEARPLHYWSSVGSSSQRMEQKVAIIQRRALGCP